MSQDQVLHDEIVESDEETPSFTELQNAGPSQYNTSHHLQQYDSDEESQLPSQEGSSEESDEDHTVFRESVKFCLDAMESGPGLGALSSTPKEINR